MKHSYYQSYDEAKESVAILKKKQLERKIWLSTRGRKGVEWPELQSNSRYSSFTHLFYHVGDEGQFEELRERYVYKGEESKNDESKNDESKNREPEDTMLFSNLYAPSDKGEFIDKVTNTFRYMFHKFKKGIYVRICDGKLKQFVPFCKKNYVNEWSTRLKWDPKYGRDDPWGKFDSVRGMLNWMAKVQGFIFKSSKDVKDIRTWYANNYLFRWDSNDNETNVGELYWGLNELCASRKIPDMEFFINKRDFPILSRDLTEPYKDIWGENHPLVSHKYPVYAPILSMCTSSNYSDIPIPTGDDWSRVAMNEGKYFSTAQSGWKSDDWTLDWSKKKSIAVFRGAATGRGVTPETNMRLKIATMSQEGVLDAGITKWKLRARKLNDKKYIQTINPNGLGIGLVKPLTQVEQSNFKYIVNIDGHVSAFRLSVELGMGSCILLVESSWKIWVHKYIKPWVHYVPVKADLGDLVEKIKWCQQNDEKCRQIAKRAREEVYLVKCSKDGLLDYMENLLLGLRKHIGPCKYPIYTPLEQQVLYQHWKLCLWMDSKTTTSTSTSIERLLFKNKLSNVTLVRRSRKNSLVVVKSTRNKAKRIENMHEAFIGLWGGIGGLENFCKIKGYYECSNVISEWIPNSIGMDKWINSQDFTFPAFINILKQIALSLDKAQKKCKFMHWDLAPWNIMIKNEGSVGRRGGKVWTPVIIDFGKSSVVSPLDNNYYGMVGPRGYFSSIHDIYYLIIKSSQCIINRKKRLLISEQNMLMSIVCFILPQLKGRRLRDLISFLNVGTSFDNLTDSLSKGKYLESLKPKDFICYLEKHLKK